MPRITILSEKEIESYDHPPKFYSADRKHFLTLPSSLQKKLSSFHTPTNKVCFHLVFAYFKACGRFFTPARFRKRDIEFVCNRLGVFSFSVDKSIYNDQTFSRHKRLVLDYFKYYPFDLVTHVGFLKTASSKMIQSQFRPQLIFNFMIEYLRHKRIELPTYNTLQIIIADAIRDYDRTLLKNLETHLTEAHKKALDKLLERPIDHNEAGQLSDKKPYLLTDLKYFDPTDNTKTIKTNIERLLQIQEIAKVVHPLIDILKLNPDAIRYYGELVIHYRIHQLKRRKAAAKYLHLIAFVRYQLCQFEDLLTDILLLECRSVNNQVRKAHLEKRLEFQESIKPTIDLVFDGLYDALDKTELIKDLLWSKVVNLTDAQIVQYFRLLFPDNEALLDKNTVREWQQKQEQNNSNSYFDLLEEHSLSLQKKVSAIVKILNFNEQTSDKQLMQTISEFRAKGGSINKSIPATFLSDKKKKRYSIQQVNSEYPCSKFCSSTPLTKLSKLEQLI